MPGSFQTNAPSGVPNVVKTMPAARSFMDGVTPYFEYPFAISGVTRDVNGNALGFCALVLFRTGDNSIAAIGSSDASGNYRLDASPALTHYLVAYLPGAPDVEGATVNTLVGA